MRLADYMIGLTAQGMATFTQAEICQALPGNLTAIQAALRRLKHKSSVAEPVQGFYVNITPEYRILGCLPADHFIDELMHYLQAPYYVGLLSAAEYHGASHHKPQRLQVMTPQIRRPIQCGKVGITFIHKKDIANAPTQFFNSPQGPISVSTAETTAMDLVSYPHRCGGMDNVLTVLSELIEAMEPDALSQLAQQNTHNITWMQRLGFLLDSLQAMPLSDALQMVLKQHRVQKRSLIATASPKDAPYNEKWKLIINAELELEI